MAGHVFSVHSWVKKCVVKLLYLVVTSTNIISAAADVFPFYDMMLVVVKDALLFCFVKLLRTLGFFSVADRV